MAARIAIAVLSATVCALIALLVLRPAAPPERFSAPAHAPADAPAPATPSGSEAALRARLEALRGEHGRLRDEVDALRSELSGLRQKPPAQTNARERAADPGLARAAGTPVDEPPRLPRYSLAQQRLSGLTLPPEFHGFDTRALRLAGLAQDEIARLESIFEDYGLDAGDLYVRAKAEGWLNTPMFRERRLELEGRYADVREAIGDDEYDRLLFGARKPNRLVISRVPEESRAAQAGLLTADLLVRYDDERIFTQQDLRLAIGQGRPRESVRVEVVRDGVWVEVWIERGSLEASVAAIRQPPP